MIGPKRTRRRRSRQYLVCPWENEWNKCAAKPLIKRNNLENDVASTSWCRRSARIDYAISAVWRRRCAHYLDKKHSTRDPQGASVSLRRARHANYGCGHRSARNCYSAVGELLSLALLSVLGICILLLGEQLCDRWIRGCGPSIKVATARAARKHGRHADVRSLHWTSICGGHSSGRRRVTLSPTTSLRTSDCGSHRPPTKAELLARSVALEGHTLRNSSP